MIVQNTTPTNCVLQQARIRKTVFTPDLAAVGAADDQYGKLCDPQGRGNLLGYATICNLSDPGLICDAAERHFLGLPDDVPMNIISFYNKVFYQNPGSFPIKVTVFKLRCKDLVPIGSSLSAVYANNFIGANDFIIPYWDFPMVKLIEGAIDIQSRSGAWTNPIRYLLDPMTPLSYNREFARRFTIVGRKNMVIPPNATRFMKYNLRKTVSNIADLYSGTVSTANRAVLHRKGDILLFVKVQGFPIAKILTSGKGTANTINDMIWQPAVVNCGILQSMCYSAGSAGATLPTFAPAVYVDSVSHSSMDTSGDPVNRSFFANTAFSVPTNVMADLQYDENMIIHTARSRPV